MSRLLCLLLLALPLCAETQLVLLGTGNPRQTPERSGPASAVVYNNSAYLFDAGPGVVRRAAAAARLRNIPALAPPQLRRLFLTHLHSDHTLGLPDLIFSPWVVGRREPLEIYGPAGTRAMVEHIEAAWKEDIDIRTHGMEHANDTGYRTIVHEIAPGYVYREGPMTIMAVPVHHGSWPLAFGYRIATPDRVIVISGDTSPVASLVEACNGCDILLHEVYPLDGLDQDAHGAGWAKYMGQFHTSTVELAEIASKAHPKLLVLYHVSFTRSDSQNPAVVLDEIRKTYKGAVVMGNDLDVY